HHRLRAEREVEIAGPRQRGMTLAQGCATEYVEKDATRLVVIVTDHRDVAEPFYPERMVRPPPVARPTGKVTRVHLSREGEVAHVLPRSTSGKFELGDGVSGMRVDGRERSRSAVGAVLRFAASHHSDAVVDQAIPERPDVAGIEGDGVPVTP